MTKNQYFKVGDTIKVKVEFSDKKYNETREYKPLKTGRGIVFECVKTHFIFSNRRLVVKPYEKLTKTKLTDYFNPSPNGPKYTIL